MSQTTERTAFVPAPVRRESLTRRAASPIKKPATDRKPETKRPTETKPTPTATSFIPTFGWLSGYWVRVLPASLTLVATDAAALAAAFGVTTVAWLWIGSTGGLDWQGGLFLASALFMANMLRGLYPGTALTAPTEVRGCFVSIIAGFGLYAAFAAFAGLPVSLLQLVMATAITGVLMPLFRRLMRAEVLPRIKATQPAIVLGGGRAGTDVYHALKNNPEFGLAPLGIVDDLNSHWNDHYTEPQWYLGGPDQLARLAHEGRVYWLVVAQGERSGDEVRDWIERYGSCFPHVLILPDIGQLNGAWMIGHGSGGGIGVVITERLLLPGPRLMKRCMDLAFCVLMAPFIVPLLMFLALVVRLTSWGPVFYRQERIGLGGKPYKMWKFRSMVVDGDRVLAEAFARNPALKVEWEKFDKLKDDPRVTMIGKLMRKCSLDELPQYFNIVVGQMSFVGPRPYPVYHLSKLQLRHRSLMSVRPGISGMWQVSGRNSTTFEQRLTIDAHYVRHWSPWSDLCILLRTVGVVARCEGAY